MLNNLFSLSDVSFSFGVLFVLLLISLLTDLRSNHIYNIVTFPAMSMGLVYHTILQGGSGLIFSMAGMFLALIMLLPMYLTAAMAAGDVKLMMAVGALLGPSDVFSAVLFSLIAGGLLACGYLLVRKGFLDAMKRYLLILNTWLRTLQWSYVPPAQHEVASSRFPYAAAIVAGTAAAVYLRMTGQALI